jgi:RimJ/RimL family protein N-acetyltransferase
MQGLTFTPLTETLAQRLAPWFDDPVTQRFLGGRDWLFRELELIHSTPGTEFRGRLVLARHVWVVQDQQGEPCALVDVGPYDDGTAGLAFVVAPHRRGQGLGAQVLLALEGREALRGVHTIIGGVEPDNLASRRCLAQAGYAVAGEPDDEGMLLVEKRIRA